MPLLDSPGTPLKFAEALASGTPLVATPEAAAGFKAAPAFVTQEPAQFADWCVELMRKPAVADRAARAGRDFAEVYCRWSQTQAPLLDWATRLLT
jgi:hypothetical protein